MSAIETLPKPTFWQRLNLWAEAMDEAVHTTEAELVARRVDRLKVRIAQLATNARIANADHGVPSSSISTDRA